MRLFKWKINSRFFEHHLPKLRETFFNRIDEACNLPIDVTPNNFLQRFPLGGAIYRIFWMHCWFPQRFPIFDQHVYRAMMFIQKGKRLELENLSDSERVASYIRNYIAFHSLFSDSEPRNVDRALWAFGKFIKGSNLPLPV